MRAASARGLHLAALTFLISLLILSLLAAVAPHLPSWIEKAVGFLGACPYRARTGTPCPLCGGLTALSALLNGNLEAARTANRAATLLAPVILLQIPYRIFRIFRPKLLVLEEIGVLAIGLLPGAMLVF